MILLLLIILLFTVQDIREIYSSTHSSQRSNFQKSLMKITNKIGGTGGSPTAPSTSISSTFDNVDRLQRHAAVPVDADENYEDEDEQQ